MPGQFQLRLAIRSFDHGSYETGRTEVLDARDPGACRCEALERQASQGGIWLFLQFGGPSTGCLRLLQRGFGADI